MNKANAHRILNAARDGQPVSQADIVAALWETGDRKPINRPKEDLPRNAIDYYSRQTPIRKQPKPKNNQA